MRKAVFCLVFMLLGILMGQPADQNRLLSLYVESQYCDQAYLRQEVQFVHYVREKQEADVYVYITAQRTGGEGTEYTLTYAGQNLFPGINDTLSFVANQNDTEDIIRKEMIRVIKLGLMQYVRKMPVSKDLTISYHSAGDDSSGKNNDRWNHWVFSISAVSDVDGEKSIRSYVFGGTIKAMRVTEKWKIQFWTDIDYNEKRYNYGDVKSNIISRERESEVDLVRSLSENWSAGMWIRYFSSTFGNIKNQIFIEPRIEYNVFPYSQSTRQQFRIGYGIQPLYQKYFEKTIYLKQSEMLYKQLLSVDMEMVKTWGSVDFGLEGSHFLHDFHKNSLEVNSELSLKVVKGLSLNLHGGFTMKRNQLALPKRDATSEEVLLQRRELESQYSFFSRIEFTYSFGALYNDIVNPRFGNWW